MTESETPVPPRELVCLRHAKSSWESDAARDFDRPLAKRGLRDAPRMGAWLRAEACEPDHIVCSPAQRTRETLAALGLGCDRVEFDERIYGGSLQALLAVLAGCPADARRVLLIGHNPGLESLVLRFGATWPADGKLFPTAAVARFLTPPDWSSLDPAEVRLVALVRPRDLS